MKPKQPKQPLLTPEIVGKTTKTFLDIIKSSYGYFTTFLAIGMFVWTLGVKSEKKDSEKINIKQDVVELKTVVSSQSDKIDLMLESVETIKEKQNEFVSSQNALRNTVVNYISNDKSLKAKDFLQYMQGLEFEIKPLTTEKSISPDTSQLVISVKKINK